MNTLPKCTVISEPVKRLAAQLNMKEAIANNYIASYLTVNNTDTLPTLNELKNYINSKSNTLSIPAFYEGNITPSNDTIFVFGSNPEGRHGAGAARVAQQSFGAIYGQGEGLQGNSYALPTKDLRITKNKSLKSISEKDIIKSIKKLYNTASKNPSKQFKIAFRNQLNEVTLNGYSGEEMINMFLSAGTIPSNIVFSKEWVNSGKFANISTNADSNIIKGENISNNIQINSDNPIAKMNREMSAIEIKNRSELISKLVSSQIDTLIDSKIEELEEELLLEDADKEAILSQIDLYNNPIQGRRAIINSTGLSTLLQNIKDEFIEYSEMSEEEFVDTYGEQGKTMKSSYTKIVDNFDSLVSEAATLIESSENLRIIIDSKLNVEQSTSDLENEESQISDDPEGSRQDIDGGWSYKVKFIDPYTTLSKKVRSILANIVRVNSDGTIIKDDLGYTKYMHPEFVYSTLMSELSESLINSNDFVIGTEGKYSFPVLESLTVKYPWINQIINSLNNDNSAISSFYSNFRKDFVQSWMLYNNELAIMNHPSAYQSTLNKIISNYEQSTPVSTNSIYGINGSINTDNIVKAQDLLDSIYTDYQNEENADLIAEHTLDLMNRLGVTTNISLIKNAIISEEGDFDLLLKNAGDILDNTTSIPESSHLIAYNKQQYQNLAKLLGEITELDKVQSYRQGDKTYQSYNAPNYITTQQKYFKRDDLRQEYIDSQFKKFEWFYDHKDNKWRSPWLDMIENDSNVRDNMQTMELNNIQGVEYTDWSKGDIYHTFVDTYFAVGDNEGTDTQLAWYNYPIFADSPVVKFIKFKRFTGENYKDTIINNLQSVVKQELYRIGLVKQRKKLGVSKISNFDNNGHLFHFFPELNNPQFIQEITEAKDSLKGSKVEGIINTYLTNILQNSFTEFLANYKANDSKYSTKQYTEEQLEEYFYNQYFATTQIIQLSVTDLAFYKDAVDFQKRFKEVYAAGNKLNINSKYGRPIERTLYLKDDIRTSNDFQNIIDIIDNNPSIDRASKKKIIESYTQINATDAQAYRSISSYRALLDMAGDWTLELEEALNNFKNGDWTNSDFNVVFQTIKPFVYSQISKEDGVGGTIKVPHQNKNSEFLIMTTLDLISSVMPKSAQLQALEQYMEENDIDVVQFESAVKSGNQSPLNFNYSIKKLKKSIKKLQLPIKNNYKQFKDYFDTKLVEGSISQKDYNELFESIRLDERQIAGILKYYGGTKGNYNLDVIHELNYEDYVIQQPTPEHLFDTEAVFGSQFRNLVIADLPEDFSIKISGKTYNKQEVLNEYNSLIIENLLEDFEKLRNRFNTIEDLQTLLLEQVKGNPKYGRDIVNALQLVAVTNPNSGEVEKVFNIPLNNPSTTIKIQELLTSQFKNAVTKQKIKGGNAILVSSFGYSDKLHIVYNEDRGIQGVECYLPAYSKQFYETLLNEDGTLDIKKLPKSLKEAIGYRIPTEDKYSMLPLVIKGFLPQQNGSSIMLPAEITNISGADFDVDKLFLMLPEFNVYKFDMFRARTDYFKSSEEQLLSTIDTKSWEEELKEEDPKDFKEWFNDNKESYRYETPKIKKVTYKNDVAQTLNRRQRNNKLIDISRSILQHPDTTSKILSPGNFDTIKRMGRISTILKDKSLIDKLQELYKSDDKITEYLRNADLGTLTKFVKDYKTYRDPLSLDTFIYNHSQNTTGGKLIGIYANNTTAHSKFQNTQLSIKPEYSFVVDKQVVSSLHDVASKYGERISKNCAEFSAASVDNVKDPVLADLMQNTKTAGVASTMLRMGLPIEYIGLMFSHPMVEYTINTFGDLSNLSKMVSGYCKTNNIPYVMDNFIKNDFTTDELIKVILEFRQFKDKRNAFNYIKYAALMAHIVGISADVNSLTRISKSDSPTNSIGTSVAKAKNQIKKVDAFKVISMNPSFTLSNVSGLMENNVINFNAPIDDIRAKLLETSLNKLQSFYSLGIESSMSIMSRYLIQINPYVDSMVDTLYNTTSRGYIADETLEKFYKELMVFGLTKSTLFGNDEFKSYDEKRDYYLYEFPKEFIQIKVKNPDLAKIDFINKLTVQKGVIQMNNSGRNTPAMIDSLMSSADSLLYTDNPVGQQLAEHLFMYSFYKESLDFGPNNFNNYFSTNFLNSFPKYVETLRLMQYDLRKGTYFDKFMPQFFANNWSSIVPKIANNKVKFNEDRTTVEVLPKDVKSMFTMLETYQYINVDDALYTLDSINSDSTKIVYNQTPIIIDNQATKYNANMTVQEMATYKTDESIINKNMSVNANSIIESNSTLDSTSANLDALNKVDFDYFDEALGTIGNDSVEDALSLLEEAENNNPTNFCIEK